VLKPDRIGVGPTHELSLRVSAAALARVVFDHPDDGVRMLALEHKATVAPASHPPKVTVKAQPFGGAVRLLNIECLLSRVGDFTFDSKRSRSDGDFRVFVRPSSLEAVHEFCLSGGRLVDGLDLETDPSRELKEEFEDTLGLELSPEMYTMQRAGLVLENRPTPTSNVRAPGQPTARVYWVYEVEIRDSAVCQSLLINSRGHTAQGLRHKALEAYARGEPGWANAALTLPLDRVRDAYLALPPAVRNEPLPFQGTLLAGNVPVVLDEVDAPKYERMS
jgi:hypothetical protein